MRIRKRWIGKIVLSGALFGLVLASAADAQPGLGGGRVRPVEVVNDDTAPVPVVVPEPLEVTSVDPADPPPEVFQRRLLVEVEDPFSSVARGIGDAVPEGKRAVIEFASVVSSRSVAATPREFFARIDVIEGASTVVATAGFGGPAFAGALGGSQPMHLVVEAGQAISVRIFRSFTSGDDSFRVLLSGRLEPAD